MYMYKYIYIYIYIYIYTYYVQYIQTQTHFFLPETLHQLHPMQAVKRECCTCSRCFICVVLAQQ